MDDHSPFQDLAKESARWLLKKPLRLASDRYVFAQLAEIASPVDSGKRKPVVETVLPLSEARPRTPHTREDCPACRLEAGSSNYVGGLSGFWGSLHLNRFGFKGGSRRGVLYGRNFVIER